MRFSSLIVIFHVVISISFNQGAQSLAIGNRITSIPLQQPPVKSNRIFVAGISETCTEQILRSTFSKFGSIQEITIIGRDKKSIRRNISPYCFISYHDDASAQRALTAPKPSIDSDETGTSSPLPSQDIIYTEVQMAKEIDVSSRRRSTASRIREREERSYVEDLGRDSNLILQVQSSHLDRLVDHLNRWIFARAKRSENNHDDDDGMGKIQVLGSTSANIKNTSLLFLATQGNPIALSRILCQDPNLARALNKSYVVHSLLEGSLATERDGRAFSEDLLNKLVVGERKKDDPDVEQHDGPLTTTIRIQVFPPKKQSLLLTSFLAVLNENQKSFRGIEIAPTGFTHMLSIVQIYKYRGKGRERMRGDEIYMAGLSPASLELDVVDTNNKITTEDGSGDAVNRAYFKLKEAFERYEADHGRFGQEFEESIALDCGSAPGGWTKYLIQRFRCEQVFSVDPGELSPSILELKATRHLQMKIEDALPIVLSNGKMGSEAGGELKVWVSDMCLHTMEDQVDILLSAKDQGLLAPNAFFVLTLKCVVGRSKNSFDTQVQKVVEKLCSTTKVERLAVYHLFSNRNGERTVMGYINSGAPNYKV